MTRSTMCQHQKAIEEHPNLLEAHLHLGEIYFEQTKTQEAIVEFTEVIIKLKSRSYRAYAELGDANGYASSRIKTATSTE